MSHIFVFAMVLCFIGVLLLLLPLPVCRRSSVLGGLPILVFWHSIFFCFLFCVCRPMFTCCS